MYKKVMAGIVALSFAATLAPMAASAETEATASVSASASISQMQELMKQIAELQAKLKELQGKQAEIRADIKESVVLMRDLREGMSSEDVKALQEILAADPEIYPEGMVTGVFGPLTRKAVMKFQAKHGLEQAGVVGPKTREKIEELMKGEFKCKAWGHLIAQGQMKRLGNVEIDISKCGKIPAGIEKKLEGDWKKDKKNATSTKASTTIDVKAPGIGEIDVYDEATTTVHIKWKTNELTTGVVWYGTEEDDMDEKETSSSFRTSHSVEIEGLDDDTEYFFRIVATDKAGNTATSSVRDFETEED